jgi:lipopolysaccharide transport system ATP-binding protein
VEKFLDTPVKRYSSGMYVRLAFAVAAHLEPEILIVDEVLAVGDAQFQKKCLGKMEDVSREGRTIVFVSHDMGSVGKLCDKAIWLIAGQVEEIGYPDYIIDRYLSKSYSSDPSKEFKKNLNKKAQILRVCLLNQAHHLTSDFACGDMVTVEIEFSINQAVQGCHLGCIVTTNEGLHLFSTADTDLNPDMFERRDIGTYKVQVSLPTTALNTGAYHIAVGVGVPNIESFDRQEAVTFNLNDVGDFATAKEGNRRAGLLLVEAAWQYQDIARKSDLVLPISTSY